MRSSMLLHGQASKGVASYFGGFFILSLGNLAMFGGRTGSVPDAWRGNCAGRWILLLGCASFWGLLVLFLRGFALSGTTPAEPIDPLPVAWKCICAGQMMPLLGIWEGTCAGQMVPLVGICAGQRSLEVRPAGCMGLTPEL